MEPLAVSPDDARAALRIGTTKLYDLLARKELEAFKVGRATRITTESIRAYIARRVEEQQAA